MSKAVQDILERIEHLSDEDRLQLERQLALQAEAEWKREMQEARRIAALRGIDQAQIDRAVERVRYGKCKYSSIPTTTSRPRKVSESLR